MIRLPEKADNATIQFGEGNLVQPFPVQTITLTPRNLVRTAPGSKFTMTLTLKTGLFSGSFTPPGTTKPIAFAGALFQKQDHDGYGDAAGFFSNQSQTGWVLLTPAP